MSTANPQHLSEQYTILSDRFRSLWTFYQFLAGIFKHLERGALPLSYDFQDLHSRLQAQVPGLAVPDAFETERALQQLAAELDGLHTRLRQVEEEFPPSLLRRFFDHLKRQDERILVALVKFYLEYPSLDGDTIDKLDILFTRLAEAPLDDGRALRRDRHELWRTFSRLATIGGVGGLDQLEIRTLVSTIGELREQVEAVGSFDQLLTSDVLDRFREFKHRLGPAMLEPQVLVELVSTNIAAKNKFESLYQVEEVRILEDTNRILEIERYLERNPDFANAELLEQIETFRRARNRFDSGRREENLKRDALLELRRAMHQILEQFDQGGSSGTGDRGQVAAPRTAPPPPEPVLQPQPQPVSDAPAPNRPVFTPEEPLPEELPDSLDYPPTEIEELEPSEEDDPSSTAGFLPKDLLLNEQLHKITAGLELAGWDNAAGAAVQSNQLHNLRLEPWEGDAYFKLARRKVVEGSQQWELQRFFLLAAALRVRMEEDLSLIEHANQNQSAERLMDALEHAARALDRAHEIEARFRWFIDDMRYRGDAEQLEQASRSRFRFLEVYARLWLERQARGGLTPR